jgi:CBS domain-containing protein
MAHVQDLLHVKGRRVHTVCPEMTVYEAVAKMNQHKIGALVVVSRDAPEEIAGIFTERDVMRRVIGQLRYADLVIVGEVMTRNPITCSIHASLDEVALTLQEKCIRHLPVVDDEGKLAGMISIGDVNAWHVQKATTTINELNDYICGRT